MTLDVCEIFYSLQGEGPLAGRPSVFLRLGGCNLSCSGFGVTIQKNDNDIVGCDSIHAVNREHFSSSWEKYSDSKSLIESIKRIVPNSKKFDIVLTGGEPTLYYNNPILHETLDYFLKQEVAVTIETNSTIEINFNKFPQYSKCIFAMAVKLSNSAEPIKRRINKKAITAISENTKNSFFKFVLDAKNIDVLACEIDEITKDYNNQIFCMPLGENSEALSQNDKTVFEFCVKKGYCYSDRTHIRVWGKKGGV